jgi:hypothetical protein
LLVDLRERPYHLGIFGDRLVASGTLKVVPILDVDQVLLDFAAHGIQPPKEV